MGLRRAWRPFGSARRKEEGHPDGDGGEGDSTGGPLPHVRDPNRWPTLVVEAGDSESLLALRGDMRWWFDKSHHEVKIVLLAKYDHHRHEILVERWEEERPTPRPGATTTRASARSPLEPVLQQAITIVRDTTTNPPSYNVARGALVLKFELLFLRSPGPGERDVVISIPELQIYAEAVWDYVGT